jgi:hypothetical protein
MTSRALDVGSMIHRNRTLIVEIDDRLAAITRTMPDVCLAERRSLRRIARTLIWVRVRGRVVGWVLQLLDTR